MGREALSALTGSASLVPLGFGSSLSVTSLGLVSITGGDPYSGAQF